MSPVPRIMTKDDGSTKFVEEELKLYCLKKIARRLNWEISTKRVKRIEYSKKIFPYSETLSKMIEEVFTRVYAIVSLSNFKEMDIDLLFFLKDYLKKRLNKKSNHLNIMLASIAFSSFLHREKFFDCDIFFKFLNGNYKPLELMYLLFVRYNFFK